MLRAGASWLRVASSSYAPRVRARAVGVARPGLRFQSSGNGEPISTEPPPPESGAGGAGGGESGPGDRVAQLETELAELKKKLREANDSRVYLLAEMENVRRIAKSDVDKVKAYAAQPIAKGLLLAVDNLTMAVGSIPGGKRKEDAAFGNLAEGVDATLKIALKVLGEHGTTEFGAPHDRFDPNKHEAVTMVPATGTAQHNTLAAVHKTGFMFKDRVLRPAQVAVYMKSEAAAEAARVTEEAAGRSTRTL
jgi:molecular chaperone GrpE